MPINPLPPGQRRDSQRSKVYKAERVLHLPYNHRGPDPKLREIAQCQAYVDRVIGSAWFKRTFNGPSRVTVAHGGGMSAARAVGRSRIELPGWGRQPVVILHELAHLIVSRSHAGAAWHGWEFASTLLRLVQHELGREAATKLRASFKTHGVRVRPKRVLSPERRAELAARLAAVRPSRAATPPAASRHLDVALAIANTV